MVGIIDYGVGNLFSLRSSFAAIGAEAFVSGDPEELAKADRLVLPGVGAFEDAAKKLKESGLEEFVLRQAREGKPLLGICLGMQLLFQESHEYGVHKGLGILPGKVVAMGEKLPKELKVPHMGWNKLEVKRGRLLANVDGEYVYFVHSFHAEDCGEVISATAEYGIPVTAAAERGNVFGCQFHPEKSGTVGLQILRNFCEMEG